MSAIKEAARAAANAPNGAAAAAPALKSLDALISRMQGYKRKVEALHEEEKTLHGHTRKRIAHLQELYKIPSLVDPAYDAWSRVRLDRLVVDLLLRGGFVESAKAFAQEKQIEELVDVEVFVQCARIEKSLREGKSTAECLAWCAENKNSLRKQKVGVFIHHWPSGMAADAGLEQTGIRTPAAAVYRAYSRTETQGCDGTLQKVLGASCREPF